MKEKKVSQSKLDELKAWITAGRFFVLPVLLAFTFYSVSLGGGGFSEFFITLLVCGSVWIAAHYINAFQDWKSGEDKLEGGSTVKDYTPACMILPAGKLSPNTVLWSGIILIIFSFVLFFAFSIPLSLIPVWLLGTFCACSYSPVFKRRHIGEICWGIAFFAFGTFAYSLSTGNISLKALAAGFLLGFVIFTFYIIDQLPDVRGPTEYAKDTAERIVSAGLPPSSFLWFSITACFVIQFGFIFLDLLPLYSGLAVFSLPIAHWAGIELDINIRKAAKFGLLWLILYTFLIGLGALLSYQGLV